MPRAVAALTMEPVLGPGARPRPARAGAEGVGQVEGRVVQRGAHQLLGEFHRQTADFFLAVLDHHLEHARFDRGRGATERDRQPAWACMVSETICSTWAMETAPWWPLGAQQAGSWQAARSRASKSGRLSMEHSASAQGHDGLGSPCSCSTDWGRAAPDVGNFHGRYSCSAHFSAPRSGAPGGVSVLLDPAADQTMVGPEKASSDCSRTKSPVAMASSAPAMALPWSGSSSMLDAAACARPWRSSARAWPSGRLLRTVASSYSTTRSKASPSSLPCSIRSASRRSAPAE